MINRAKEIFREEGILALLFRCIRFFFYKINLASSISIRLIKAGLYFNSKPINSSGVKNVTDINRTTINNNTYGNMLSVYRIYQPWADDSEFQQIWSKVKKFTMNDILRAYNLYKAVEQVNHLDGAMIEVGTHNGGLGCLMAKKAANDGIDMSVYLCDTFSGIVKSGDHDSTFQSGDLSGASPNKITELAKELQISPQILEGTFPDEVENKITEKKVRLAHIDVDVYKSTKDSYEWIWPKLACGGVIIIDDFGFKRADGVRKFVSEIENNEDNYTQYLLNTQAVIVKTSNN